MIATQHRRTLGVGAIIVFAALVCGASTQEMEQPSTAQSLSLNTTEFVNSTNEGKETSLAAVSTQATTSDTSSSTSKTLGITTTVFTSAQPLSSDAFATANYTEPTAVISGSMPTSSTHVTSVSAVSLSESGTSPVKIASETLVGGVSPTTGEGASPDTSEAVMVTATTSDNSTLITSSSGDATSSRAINSTSAPATAAADISTMSTTYEKSIGFMPTSSSSTIVSDKLTSQSTVTSMFTTNAVNSVMISSSSVSPAALDTTSNGMSTVLSSTDSSSLDFPYSGVPSTTQNGSNLSYSRTADAAATSTTATPASPNVYSTFNSNVNDTALTIGAASSGSTEPSTLAVDLPSSGTVNNSVVNATTLVSALSNGSSLTTTNSLTISPTSTTHGAFDNATSVAFTSAVGIAITSTVSTASDSQRNVSKTDTTDEVRLASNDTVTTSSLMTKSIFQSSPTTEGASVFPNVTSTLGSSSGGNSSSDMTTAFVKINTTSEIPVQPATGYDTTRSDRIATSATPVFTAEKETISTLISEMVTQPSSTILSTWGTNMSSTDSSTASYVHSTTSGGISRSESSASFHASTPWSTSASTEFPTALPGVTSVLTSVSTAQSTTLNPPLVSSVTAPKDLTTVLTSTLNAFGETTAGNASTAQPIPFVSGSQALSSQSAATSLQSNVSYPPNSSPSINISAASSSEAAQQSSAPTNPIESKPTISTTASASKARSDVTTDVTNIGSSAGILSFSRTADAAAISTTAISASPNVYPTFTSNANDTVSTTVSRYDTTRSDSMATSAAPVFTSEKETMSSLMSATVTQPWSTTLSTWSTNMSSTDSSTASYVHSTTSGGLQRSESSTSFPAITPWSTSAAAELPTTQLGNSTEGVTALKFSNASQAATAITESVPANSTNRSISLSASTQGAPAESTNESTIATPETHTATTLLLTTAVPEGVNSSHTDSTTMHNTTANVGTEPSMRESNFSTGADQLTSMSSAITAASPASAVGNNATISSQPGSTERLASADLSTAPTIGPNQTTTATAAGTAAGASSSASTTAEQNNSSDAASITAAPTVSVSAVTSPAANFLANASSATSTAVTYLQSTPTLSIASQSVNSTEASRSNISSLLTTPSYSYSSTEVSQATVSNQTSMKPIRPNFTVESGERKYGAVVQMTTNVNIAKFESLRSSLQQELTNLTNKICNSAPLFPLCCRQSGSRLADDPWRVFVKTQDVYVGQAQNPLVGQVWLVVAMAPEANNSLCTYGGSESSGKNASRNKRDVNFREENILDPTFLTKILSNATSEIANIVGNLTNTTVTVNLIDLAEVVARQLEVATAGAATTTRTSVFVEGSPSSLIAWVIPVTFILAIAILVVAVVVACRRKRRGFAKMLSSGEHKSGAYNYELHMLP